MSAWKADALPLGDARMCAWYFTLRQAGGQARAGAGQGNGDAKTLLIIPPSRPHLAHI